MIEIELGAMRFFPAVLTREFVSSQDVDPAVANVSLRDPVETGQQDHARNSDRAARRADAGFVAAVPGGVPVILTGAE